jgi:hypothetical protein
MFRFNYHHQGVCYLIFAKVTVAKTVQSLGKIHRCGQFGGVLFQTVSQTYTNQDLIIYAATPLN